ncbi:hypothetical protein [Streptomyces cadmiisoli]|uniref:hypothetical protein n=1 Tax=Streptomyces cadmiisoli TaxID=2184053 RepID=UPI0018EF52B8|nr:hypothetical protein [Streptomyces cadmiisoli]
MQNPTETGPDRLRPIGIDPTTGKRQFAVTEPGSALDAMADGYAIKAAAALVTVTGAAMENGDDVSDLVPELYSALAEMVDVATKHYSPLSLNVRELGPVARALGEALQAALRP